MWLKWAYWCTFENLKSISIPHRYWLLIFHLLNLDLDPGLKGQWLEIVFWPICLLRWFRIWICFVLIESTTCQDSLSFMSIGVFLPYSPNTFIFYCNVPAQKNRLLWRIVFSCLNIFNPGWCLASYCASEAVYPCNVVEKSTSTLDLKCANIFRE